MKKNLDDIRSEFAEHFLKAISEKSIEKLQRLLLSHDDHMYLSTLATYISGKTYEEDDYNKALSRQTETFLNKANKFIDKKNSEKSSRIMSSNLNEVKTYRFEINDEPMQSMDTITISMKPRLIDGVNYRVGFEIKEALLINDKIKITNWYFVKFYESFWDDVNEDNTPFPKIEDKKTLTKLFENFNHEFSDYIHNWQWYLHEGDLVLEKYDLKVNLIVTGNLTIKEPLPMIGHELVVFGKTNLNALHIDESNNVLFINGIEFKVGIFIAPWSSGAYQLLNKPKGPLIYSLSETTEVDDMEHVQYYQDANTEGTSNLQSLVRKNFLEKNEDDEYVLDFDQSIATVKTGDSIIK